MNCRTVSDNLSAYVDRELPPEALRTVEHHLDRCERCRIEETELRRLKLLLGSAEPPSPDQGFEERLRQCLAREVASATDFRQTYALVAGLLLTVAVSGAFIVTHLSHDSKPPAMAAKAPDMQPGLAQDQIFYMTASQPQFGAPVLTAVDYAR